MLSIAAAVYFVAAAYHGNETELQNDLGKRHPPLRPARHAVRHVARTAAIADLPSSRRCSKSATADAAADAEDTNNSGPDVFMVNWRAASSWPRRESAAAIWP